jgi:hypothetical protein
MEQIMTVGGLEFLILVVSALSLFAGVLAWACWMEGRETKRAAPVIKTAKGDETYPQFGNPTHRAF